jgi:Bacterial archaeo-eukaryotic release factor family 10
MRLPTRDRLRELIEWRPDNGVVSVYAEIDPGDRGGGWRIAIRNRLRELAQAADVPGPELASASERILARLDGDDRPPAGRTLIGFVEADAEPRTRERWYATQLTLPSTLVVYLSAPLVTPLVLLADRGAPRVIALVSAERVRLLLWAHGTSEEVASWGLEILSLDWRERKAQRPSDAARGQGVSASGKDRFGDRLEANRERFLREAGGLTAARAADLGAGQIVVAGAPEHSRPFAAGANGATEVEAADVHDLIAMPIGEVTADVQRHLEQLDRARDEELVRRVTDAARSGDRGALGRQETAQALEQGRVEHLLVAFELGVAAGADGLEGLELAEGLVSQALLTDARVTLVEGEAVQLLDEAEGVAALLRY